MTGPYDYPAFTAKLAGLKGNEMMFYLEDEIERVQRLVEQRHSLADEIARQSYLRKLSRLVLLLRRQEIPLDLSPVERQAFALVAESLVQSGEMATQIWLKIARGA